MGTTGRRKSRRRMMTVGRWIRLVVVPIPVQVFLQLLRVLMLPAALLQPPLLRVQVALSAAQFLR